MDKQETVIPEPASDLVNDLTAEQPQEAQEVEPPQEQEEQEEKQVPLRAVQKERKKRHKAEERNRLLEKQLQEKQEPDESRFESATKEDLGKSEVKSQAKAVQQIREDIWMEDNPEKYEVVMQDLESFLELRPNYVSAIENAKNRYKEAWELMSKLNPRQKQQVKTRTKPDAPGSPSGVPKAAALNEAIDLHSMSDSEFNAWRKKKMGRG